MEKLYETPAADISNFVLNIVESNQIEFQQFCLNQMQKVTYKKDTSFTDDKLMKRYWKELRPFMMPQNNIALVRDIILYHKKEKSKTRNSALMFSFSSSCVCFFALHEYFILFAKVR